MQRSRCGNGLFAREPFAPEEVLMEYCGKVISERHFRSKDYCFLMEEDGERKCYVDAAECGSLARFVNHACGESVNAQFVVAYAGGVPHIVLVASKYIDAGDEIFVDYKEDFHFERCLCPDCEV